MQGTTHLIQRHVTKKEVRVKIQQTIGPHEDLTIVETKTDVVWTCLLFIRSGQNHIARQSERGKKTKQTEEEVGRQHQGMDRPVVRQVPEGRGEQTRKEKTGCEVICGTPNDPCCLGITEVREDQLAVWFSTPFFKCSDTCHPCESWM